MNEMTFEQRISEEVTKQLNSGMVEQLIAEKLEKGIASALDSVFGYNGIAKKAVEEKVKEIMVPVIERHDFNKYIVKLDDCLSEIVNSTNLIDNKKILENFQELMKEPEKKEIRLSEIFEQYCKHVAANVDTSSLETDCEDGEPYYEHVTATLEVEHKDKGWFKSDYDDCYACFKCEEDENLNCQISLYKKTSSDKWTILKGVDSIDICSLRLVSQFEILLSKINRGYVNIIMDTEDESDDDIELDEKPEWSLN